MRALHSQYQTKDDAELVLQVQALVRNAINTSTGKEQEMKRIIHGGLHDE